LQLGKEVFDGIKTKLNKVQALRLGKEDFLRSVNYSQSAIWPEIGRNLKLAAL
jgi:hypothetical protein